MSTQSRGWCFTLNNFSDEEEKNFKKVTARYICIGKEIGKCGTPHLQGFVYFDVKKRLSTLKKLSERAHWEPSRGTPQQAAAYCQKDGNFWEEGEKPVMGARSDLAAVAEQVRNGASLQEVASENPEMFVRYTKGLTALKMTLMKDRTEKPVVSWLWGGTGVGKTKRATEINPSFYMKDGTQWWDGYEQQNTIIVDDFDGKWPFRDLLRFLDGYPYQGQYKGGYVKINSPNIVITCEYHPSHFWKDTELKQVLRRLSDITFLTVPEESVPEVVGNTMPQP